MASKDQAAYQREWRKRNRDKVNARIRRWRESHPETWKVGHARRNARYVSRLKEKIVAEYGGRCECCGDSHIEFLTIDHIQNDGAEHRRQLNTKGFAVYLWLKRNNFPKDNFRLLCWNCNSSRGTRGYCPHEKERNEQQL